MSTAGRHFRLFLCYVCEWQCEAAVFFVDQQTYDWFIHVWVLFCFVYFGIVECSERPLFCFLLLCFSRILLIGRGPPGPPPGSRMASEPPRPAAAPKFGHLIVKCVKGIELKVPDFFSSSFLLSSTPTHFVLELSRIPLPSVSCTANRR